MKKSYSKGCLITGIACIAFCAFVVWKCSRSSFFKTYDKKDLTGNYDTHEAEMKQLIAYFRAKTPSYIHVDIEINDIKNIDIFHVVLNGQNYGGWDIDVDSPKADTIFNLLNWDKSEIKTLKKKLDAVNCISIDNRNPARIGFQRSVMSKFSYVIFDEPITENDSLMKIYDTKCIYIHYRDNVVLEYGSGATGSLCFPERFLE